MRKERSLAQDGWAVLPWRPMNITASPERSQYTTRMLAIDNDVA
jgi:hypothetical protein